MKVHELISELLKYPAGSEVVLDVVDDVYGDGKRHSYEPTLVLKDRSDPEYIKIIGRVYNK